MPVRLILSAVLTVVAATPLAQAADGYGAYRNARFGFGIGYPAPLLKPGIPAANGDGLKFISRDKQTTLEAYGRIAPEGATIKTLYREALGYYKRYRVTYTRQRENWFVISGFVADQLIFYRAGMLYRAPGWSATPGAMIFASFEISWPESRRDQVDKHIGHILRSFLKSPHVK